MGSKKGMVLAGLLLAAAGGTGAWLWQTEERPAHETRLTLYGNTDIRQVQLAFNGGERIARMLAVEGERVKRGQLLAELDTRRLQYAVDRSEAQLAARRQVVARLEAGTRAEEINQARANVEAARVTARNARRSYDRLRDLASRKLASREQTDNARTAAEAAQARLGAATATLELSLAGPRKEDIAAARATLKAYQAQLDLARRNLADARLYAPADGVIRDRILEPGDMASPQTPVYTLALTDLVWVRAYVGEPDLGKIRSGIAAEVRTDSYPDKRYRAWVGYISPTAEFTPKTVETTRVRTDLVYQVRVFVCNPDGELRLGMPATVTIPLGTPPPAGRPGDADRCKQP